MDNKSLPDMENDKAESSMLPKNVEEEDGNRWNQIFAAVAICYICICGGNLSGYTSSAIPSMRQPSFHIEKICNTSSSSAHRNMTDLRVRVTKTLAKIHVERGNFSGSDNRMIAECVSVTVGDDMNQFQNITDGEVSWISGLAPLGAFVGSLVATVSVKGLGPKGSILYAGCPLFLISWIITAMSQSVYMIYGGRFLGGIALGLTISLSPLYIMDTASVKLRGPLGTLTQFLFTLGVLSTFILGSFLDWRKLAWTSAANVLPCIALLTTIPESPVWLLSKGRRKLAEYAFLKMRGESADFKSFLETTLECHTDVNQNTEGDERSGISLFWKLNKAERKSCLVAIALCVFQQLSGINGVNYYTLSIFKAASEGSTAFVLSGHVSSIIVASVFCLATFPSYLLIEKCGRKLLLLSSIAVMIISSAGLGAYFYVKEIVHDSFAFRMTPLVCLILFVLAFSSGFGPILYILVAEILSPEIRPVFSPLAIGINWFAVFAITKTFPDLIAITGIHGVFWLYSTLSVVGLIFVIFCVPETKGKTEKEIEKYFW